MKTNRYILSLLLLVVSVFNLTPANAQQNQYAIYNYRNDGDFNAWLNIDVDSITYSCIDTFGVEHDDVVVQEVWTPDSVYRIPINAIDSLAFRAPKTVIKSDVFIIREIHVPYTLDVDSLSLLFDSSIPASMLPSIGQVVVSETFDGVYEEGFVGKVIKINNLGSTIEIICEDATLFDIYDQLIAVGKFESVEESSHSSKKLLPKRILGFDDVDKSGEYTFEIGKLKLQHNKFPWVSAEYTPELKFEYVLYIHKDDPIHVKFLISGKHDVALNVDYKVSEKLSTESKDEIWIADVPLPYFYGFKPIFKIGLFYKVGGKAHVTGKIPVTISHGLGFEYHGSGFDISNVNILKSFDMNFGEPTLDLKIDGYMAGGLCADLGVKFLHKKLASIEGILKMGPKLTTSFDLSANDIVNDPSAYSILKNTKLKADFDIGIDAKYRILKKQARILPGKGWPGVKNVNQYEKEEDWPKGEISWSWNLFECYILPEFTHSFSSYNNQQAVFSTTASRELFFPVKIGAQIEKNGIIETVMQPNSYWSEYFDAKTRTFDTQFDDIALGNTYTSKPVVEILGCRLTASPAAKLNTAIKHLSLKEGTKDTITIGDGKTTFSVKSDNPKVATCSIDKKDKSKMIVNAIKQGVATIILTDTKKNESSMLQVTVVDKNTTDLTLSVAELDLNTESSASVLITSGSGNYMVESSNSEVATAECTDNTILVTAHTVGTATITVTDTESGFTATINVTVTEEATDDLALSESTVSMKPNETAEVAITSGSGSYTVANSNEEVAVAAISNGDKVAIAARKAGTATITVTDTKTKQTATIAVTVTDGAVVEGQTFTVNGVSFKMIGVEGGTFTMGATAEQGSDAYFDESPTHQVTLSSFAIGQTEVTQELWEAVMGSNPSSFKGAKRPVECVSWNDCQTFITKLNQLTGKKFRLPTEAEWEYAARGGKNSKGYKYAGSNTIDEVAWYTSNSGDKTHDVVTKKPNELGLYDMSGNVWEWCQDWYSSSYYSSSPQTNPTGPSSGSGRVLRGGSWNGRARYCRVSFRNNYDPDNRNYNRGLRLAL